MNANTAHYGNVLQLETQKRLAYLAILGLSQRFLRFLSHRHVRLSRGGAQHPKALFGRRPPLPNRRRHHVGLPPFSRQLEHSVHPARNTDAICSPALNSLCIKGK